MSKSAIVSVAGALVLASVVPHVAPQRSVQVRTERAPRAVTPSAQTSPAGNGRYRTASELIAEYDGDSTLESVSRAHRGKLTVIIATLPDPVDSHMEWAFDSGLESIRRANEATGFVADRFWLPWPGAGDSVHVKGSAALHPVRDVYPGVLLFRPTSPIDSSLRVFLIVGETPAYGLRVRQFEGALAERDQLLGTSADAPLAACRDNQWTLAAGKTSPTKPAWGAKGKTPRTKPAWGATGKTSRAKPAWGANPNVLRIVGPVSSGTSASLRRALDRWRKRIGLPACTCVAEIVSGGATNAGNKTWFPSPSYSFHATVHSDGFLQAAMEHYLAQMGIGSSEIAYLREGSSYGYGAAQVENSRFGTLSRLRARVDRVFADSVSAQLRHDTVDSLLIKLDTVRPNDTHFQAVIHAYSRKYHYRGRADAELTRRDSILRIALAGLTRGERDSQPIAIRFPVNISRLRGEYARHPIVVEGAPGTAPGPRIPLNLSEGPVTEDAPFVASDLTAPSLDFILAEMANTLRSHHIKAVGILASDVRDKMFLADELKHRVRDVQLFSFGSNVLLAREDFGSLRGMLVVSSYPLTLENQHWDPTLRDTRERKPFQSDIAEGIYNATLFQLDQGQLATDYALPLHSDHTASPPVWISAVGKRTTLPILFDNAFIPVRPDSLAYLEASHGVVPATQDDTIFPLRAGIETGTLSEFREYGFFTVTLILAFLATYAVAQYRINARARTALANLPDISWSEADTDARRIAVYRHALMFRRELYALIRLGAITLVFFAVALFTMRTKAHGQLFDAWRYLIPGLFIMTALFALTRAALPLARLARHGTVPWATHWSDVKRDSPVHGLAWLAGIVARVLLVALAVVWMTAFIMLILDIGFLLDHAPGNGALFFLRTTAIGSGLSPAWPLLLGGFGLMSWCAWHLRRVGLLGRVTAFEYFGTYSSTLNALDQAFAPRAANAPIAQRPKGVLATLSTLIDQWHTDKALRDSPAADVRSVRRHLFFAVPGARGAALLLFLVLFAAYQWWSFHDSFESGLLRRWKLFGGLTSYDVLYRTIIISAVVSIAWALYRLLATWLNLRDLLRAIGYTPLLTAFRRSSNSFSRLTRITPFDVPADPIVDRQIATKYAALRALVVSGTAKPVAMSSTTYAELRSLKDPPRARASLFDLDTNTFGSLLPRLLFDVRMRWKSGAVGSGDKLAVKVTNAMEDLLVPYVIDYVEWVFAHLRSVAFFLAAALLATTGLLWSYPFLPESGIRVAYILLACFCIGSLLYVLVDANRNEVLSSIAHTRGGQVTWDWNFISNLVIFGLLPMLALLGAQYPVVGDFLFSWVTPAIRAVVKI